MTPIFRSFHRTASSTTGGWSHWNIFNVFLYNYHSEHYGLIFRGYHINFYKVKVSSFFIFVYISRIQCVNVSVNKIKYNEFSIIHNKEVMLYFFHKAYPIESRVVSFNNSSKCMIKIFLES